MIMVGPGTGVAPFRAFLEERHAVGAKGKNWLFFGDQRATSDFLYREQLETMQRDGLLARLDTAFSRDQAEKIYVQHRMLENAAELYAWLEAGAHFYVCGDASRMAKDVDAALHKSSSEPEGKHPSRPRLRRSSPHRETLSARCVLIFHDERRLTIRRGSVVGTTLLAKKPSSSPPPAASDTRTLIDELIAEQRRLQTPVARFSEVHDRGTSPALESLYRDLIPLTRHVRASSMHSKSISILARAAKPVSPAVIRSTSRR